MVTFTDVWNIEYVARFTYHSLFILTQDMLFPIRISDPHPVHRSRTHAMAVSLGLSWSALLLTLILGLCQESESASYQVSPTQSQQCSGTQHCTTLSGLSPLSPTKDVNVMLMILSGNHSLNTNLSFSNLINFTMYSESMVTIVCEPSVLISIESIERVFIQKLIFIGCGGNLVRNIDNFILQDITFEGRNDSGTALTVIDTAGKIINCTFMQNQCGTAIDGVRTLILLTTDISWFLVGDVTGVIRISSALISSYSNITISGTTFEDNKAETGGDIFTENSSRISIFNSTFTGEGLMTDTDEEAPFGGAIFSYEGEYLIQDCHFRYKNATVGGAIVSSLSTFTISN